MPVCNACGVCMLAGTCSDAHSPKPGVSHTLSHVQVLDEHNIVHYDLKADNVLLKEPAAAEAGQLPFGVVVADFGETRQYASSECARTTRHVLWLAACPGCPAAAWLSCCCPGSQVKPEPLQLISICAPDSCS